MKLPFISSYIILFLFLIKTNISLKLISIPFKVKFIKGDFYTYKSSDFFNDYFKKELILQINLGNPPQQINAFIDPYSYCFEFKLSESNKNNNYYPYKSTTFHIDKFQFYKNNYPKYISSTDLFYFSKNETYNLSFVTNDKLDINNNKEITLIAEIGINNPITYLGSNLNSCNNFIYDLRNMNAINKRIFSIIYKDNYRGQFLLGDDLTKYNSTRYKKDNYYTKYFSYDFMFLYDNIYMTNYLNQTEYLNITGNTNKKEAIINLNSGLIIGTEDYKNYIHKYFFKYLIENRICKLDLVKLNQIKDKDKFGNEFYIYSCYHLDFVRPIDKRYQNRNYYSEFPNLIIESKSFEYNFELTKENLFETVYSRDYFLVVFPKDINDEKNKNIWYLGEPFYKRYPFTINLDAKTIGFYLDKKDISERIDDNKNTINEKNNDKNIIMKDNNSSVKKILIKFGEIMLGIGLLLIAYYIGMKVKEGRKKRANELKDDCYEYISDNKHDINETKSEQKNNQFVELNSKLIL